MAINSENNIEYKYIILKDASNNYLFVRFNFHKELKFNINLI